MTKVVVLYQSRQEEVKSPLLCQKILQVWNAALRMPTFAVLREENIPRYRVQGLTASELYTEVFFNDDFRFSCARKVRTTIPVARLLRAMLSFFSFSFSSFMGRFPKNHQNHKHWSSQVFIWSSEMFARWNKWFHKTRMNMHDFVWLIEWMTSKRRSEGLNNAFGIVSNRSNRVNYKRHNWAIKWHQVPQKICWVTLSERCL